ncbi:DEAD/DEAH box helicase family protein [Shimazuella sp. AN120528]|uniref:DEAD/DEAH box helicase family protein n=1 Tax=Shimazuella soli TaxID=1892854 RepID=UPI001F0EEB1C|nr:DEAD/DEAH box helicase family protein [Shimazuella soli]MCH5584070.1 DEAD/DEAH box helicase family protein [Shimazuella soli]
MLSNFEFLQEKKLFASFAGACSEAEQSMHISPATCAILSRRALELAVKWLYEHDSDLRVPYRDNLTSLIQEPTFKAILDEKIRPVLRYVVQLGNSAVHTNVKVRRDEAMVSLHYLHQFVSWVDYCYADHHTAGKFDEKLVPIGDEQRMTKRELQDLFDRLSSKDRKLEEVIKENAELRERITSKRKENTQDYDFQVDQLDEAETRKRYVDLELKLAGWNFEEDVREEVRVEGMPNQSGKGYVDYVLFGDNGKPLAVVETKKTSHDAIKGQHQAKLYADCVEKQFGQRPVIFYTNGFEMYIWDYPFYPERKISGFYSKEELDLLIQRRDLRKTLDTIEINTSITERYYQKEAILSVCQALEKKQRSSLIVMATGSGKTRTVISIVDVLVRHNWVKNVLFLADRRELVKQAKNAFLEHLPTLPSYSLVDSKNQQTKAKNKEEKKVDVESANLILSTYGTMLNKIDEAKRKDGKKLFTVGYFDLIIVDESHRSIYKKYGAIFDYFDSLLVGLTATPKAEVDYNTYEIFDLESGVPTYAYELDQAVKDKHLVLFHPIETKLKFLEKGICYDDLSDEEKEKYEDTFGSSDDIPDKALNDWLFNDNTIDKVIVDLMERGLKVEGGEKLGKSIIFAKNKKHADRIVKRFNKLYPEYVGDYAKAIVHEIPYVDNMLENFKNPQKMPQIAVSVDMLDTGIDIPEILNLVFFKKVRSKAKFWQMVGRGTRTCPDLFGVGLDKEYFQIFDYCNNIEFFRVNEKGIEGKIAPSLSEQIFALKVDIIKELQSLDYQEEDYIAYRNELIDDCIQHLNELNEDHFRVRQQIKNIHHFKYRTNWNALTSIDAHNLKKFVAPLILTNKGEELQKRFDLITYGLKLARLQGVKNLRAHRVIEIAKDLSKMGSIPQVVEQKEIIKEVQTPEFWQKADIFSLEIVRLSMRDLVRFLERESQQIFYTNFKDEVLEVHEGKEIPGSFQFKAYHQKVNEYLQEHQDLLPIYKIHHNKALTKQDIQTLEKILWEELGTRKDYERDFGKTPIAKLVRKTIGLNQLAANEAFSEFLSDEQLNANQARFVKLIIDYVVKNGCLEKKVLQEEPFRTLGSIVELFKGNEEKVRRIISTIDWINGDRERA